MCGAASEMRKGRDWESREGGRGSVCRSMAMHECLCVRKNVACYSRGVPKYRNVTNEPCYFPWRVKRRGAVAICGREYVCGS